MESGNGGLGSLVVGHLHKRKASGAASVTVHNDMDLVHSTIRLEELAEVMLSRAERKIANSARSQGSNPWQTQVMALGVSRSTSIFLWTWSPISAIKRPSV